MRAASVLKPSCRRGAGFVAPLAGCDGTADHANRYTDDDHRRLRATWRRAAPVVCGDAQRHGERDPAERGQFHHAQVGLGTAFRSVMDRDVLSRSVETVAGTTAQLELSVDTSTYADLRPGTLTAVVPFSITLVYPS
jgi:hypothetical protein